MRHEFFLPPFGAAPAAWGWLILPLCACLAAAPPAHADDATETQLRAALQQATNQIAQLEDQVANLQAQQAPNTALINALQAKLKNYQQQGGSPAAQAANKKQLAALEQKIARQQSELGRLQGDYTAADAAAGKAKAANQKLAAKLKTLNTQLDSCSTKNTQLYQLGTQILDAYSHKDDPLQVFASHEPFIGFARVKLQNIVQDDQDKLDQNQFFPNGGAP